MGGREREGEKEGGEEGGRERGRRRGGEEGRSTTTTNNSKITRKWATCLNRREHLYCAIAKR